MKHIQSTSVFTECFCNASQSYERLFIYCILCIQLFQLRLSPEQSGKVEYERERLLGIANKFIHLLAIPSSLSRSYSTFPLARGTTFIEIAVCIGYFEATRGRTTCDLFTEARSAEVNKHISPRCLKITYLFFTLRGRVNESE